MLAAWAFAKMSSRASSSAAMAAIIGFCVSSMAARKVLFEVTFLVGGSVPFCAASAIEVSRGPWPLSSPVRKEVTEPTVSGVMASCGSAPNALISLSSSDLEGVCNAIDLSSRTCQPYPS